MKESKTKTHHINLFCAQHHLIFVQEFDKDQQKGMLFKDFRGETIFKTTEEVVKITDNVP